MNIIPDLDPIQLDHAVLLLGDGVETWFVL